MSDTRSQIGEHVAEFTDTYLAASFFSPDGQARELKRKVDDIMGWDDRPIRKVTFTVEYAE